MFFVRAASPDMKRILCIVAHCQHAPAFLMNCALLITDACCIGDKKVAAFHEVEPPTKTPSDSQLAAFAHHQLHCLHFYATTRPFLLPFPDHSDYYRCIMPTNTTKRFTTGAGLRIHPKTLVTMLSTLTSLASW